MKSNTKYKNFPVWSNNGFCNIRPGDGHLYQDCVFSRTSVRHVTFQAFPLNIRYSGYQIGPFTNSSPSYMYEYINCHNHVRVPREL